MGNSYQVKNPVSSENKTAVITGATSGIGAAFANNFASRGYDLIITGRKKDILSENAIAIREKYNVEVEEFLVDFSDEEAFQKLVATIKQRKGIEVLVNNAGFGAKKGFLDEDFEPIQRMIRVHVDATTCLTHAVISIMLQNGGGCIINVASLASFFPSPYGIMYTATKSFLVTFSKSLSIALKEKNIKIQALCPGFTNTNFHSYNDEATLRKNNFGIIRWMEPEQIVCESVKALSGSKVVVCPGINNKLILILRKLIPDKLYMTLAYKNSSSIINKALYRQKN